MTIMLELSKVIGVTLDDLFLLFWRNNVLCFSIVTVLNN